jgi:catalase
MIRTSRRSEARVLLQYSTTVFLLASNGFAQPSAADLSRQIAEVMSQGQSGKAHERYVHAKGIVCQGTFQASAGAAAISRAPHFDGKPVAVTIRFSDGAPDTAVTDTSPEAAPRGMAIRFAVGPGTDIMAFSHNGFLVGTGEDFLALVKAQAETDKTAPHPWPIEEFLSTHPRALKFVQDPKPVPVSFATESFYANNAFVFVNAQGRRQAGRYQIVPVDGGQYLDDAALKTKSSDFLSEELRGRLVVEPARFRLLLQLPNPGDQTSDASIVWPDDRRKVELGIITVASVGADSVAAERKLAFDPTHLIDGIELSDDPLPALRSRVYTYSVAGRQRN